MIKKKIFILLIIHAIFFLGIFSVAKSGLLVKGVKNNLESELSKALNKKVTIGRIEGGIFNSITLYNVRISNAEGVIANKSIEQHLEITIEKVSIEYSIFDIIFRKKEVLESIKDIKLIKPEFILNKNEKKEILATFDKASIKLSDNGLLDTVSGIIRINKIKTYNVSMADTEISFKYTPNLLNISEIKSNIFGGSFFGNIDIDINSGSLNGKASLNNAGISKISDTFFMKKNSMLLIDSKPRGFLNINFSITGTNSKPEINGDADITDIRIRDGRVPSQKISFNYSDFKLNLKSETGNKELNTFFDINFKNKEILGSVQIRKYEIRNIIDLVSINHKDISGLLNADFRIKGDLESPLGTVNGNLSINDFKLKKFGLNKLYTDLSINNNVLTVARFISSQSEGGYISGNGLFDLKNIDPISAKFEGKKINIAGLPFGAKAIPNLAGLTNFKVTINGRISEPEIRVSVSSNRLIINETSKVSINGEFLFNKRRMEIEKFKIDDEYNLHGKIIFSPIKAIFIHANTEKGKFLTLTSILGLKETKVKGNVKGKVNLKGVEKAISGDGFISADNIVINKFNIDKINLGFLLSDNILKIIRFDIIDKSNILLAKADVFLGDETNFKVNADFSKDIGKTKLISSITGEGKIHSCLYETYGRVPRQNTPSFSLMGKFSTDVLRIGKYDFPKINANFEYKNKELKFSPVSFGSWVSLHGSLKFEGVPNVSANIDFKNMPIQDVTPFIYLEEQNKDKLKGYLRGAINISGEIVKPNISGFIKVDDGEIRSVKFKTLYLDFAVNHLYNVTFNMIRLQQKESIISAKGTLAIPEEKTSFKNSYVDLDVEMMNVSVLDIHKLISLNLESYVNDGIVTAKAKITGKLYSPKLAGAINIINTKIYNIDTKEISTNFIFDKEIFSIDDLKWNNKNGRLVIKSGKILSRKNNLEVSLKFAESEASVAGVNLNGDFNFDGVVKLSDKTSVSGIITTGGFRLNNYDISNMKLDLFYTEGRLKFKGQMPNDIMTVSVNLSLPPEDKVIFNECRLIIGDGKVLAKGTLSKSEDSKFGITLENLDLMDLSKILNITTVDITGKVSAFAELTGKSGSTKVSGNVKLNNGSIEDVLFDSLGAGIQIVNNELTVKKGYLFRKDKYNVSFNGTIPLSKEKILRQREINFYVNIDDGDLDLISFLGWFNKTKGKVNAKLYVSGTSDYPVLNGFAEVKEPAILYPKALVKEIKNFTAKFEFKDNKASIVYLYGEIGKGNINATGHLIMKRLDADTLDFKITTLDKKEGIDFNILGLMDKIDTGRMHLSSLEGNEKYFTITGPVENPKFSGKISLYQTKFTYPLSVSDEEASGFEFLKKIYWEVKVEANDNNWYYNEHCNIKVKKWNTINFTGPGKDIKVTGFVESDKGTFKYLQTDFNLNYAAIKFVEDGKTRALLTAKSETRVKDIRVYADVSGDRDDKKQEFGEWGRWAVKLTSVPELTQQQIVSYLTIGEDYTTWSDKEINQKLQTEFASILIKQGINIGLKGVVKTIKKVTTIDDIRIKPSGYRSIFGGSSSTGTYSMFEGTELNLGKYLTESLYLGYNIVYQGILPTGDLSSWKHELQIDYRFWQRVRGKLRLSKDELYGGLENIIPF